ncbi:class II fructose-bisphosphate aldolase [Acetonema longum]|uniref:Fructose-bisphosphate aldolase n=1 Tax=Acetonema longum DSM 6540 TaxID=1009370 RepID=F7NNG0_9FIRM|nr:class II fructose-bisphosphate aldolase [Acetonema longum]EGO62401.1 fructose-bisphosphate aldolase [Acetonema longum DSM 6540]
MALVTMREVLQNARKRKYAVGGFNVFNLETLGAVVEVAEELKSPLVLGIPERLLKFVDADTLAAAMVKAAQKSSVPIALHLDHGYSYEGMMKAIRWGFTSIMYDGSSLAYAENLKRTKEITRIAHSLDMSVEGELGFIDSFEGPNASHPDSMVTPEMAAEFAHKTQIDALAIAVSNNHGSSRGNGNVNIQRLSELSGAVAVPLVMHGGAKLTRDEYRQSIQTGITKINVATDASSVAADTLKTVLEKSPGTNYISLMGIVKKAVKDSVRKYMLSFDCISKAI